MCMRSLQMRSSSQYKKFQYVSSCYWFAPQAVTVTCQCSSKDLGCVTLYSVMYLRTTFSPLKYYLWRQHKYGLGLPLKLWISTQAGVQHRQTKPSVLSKCEVTILSPEKCKWLTWVWKQVDPFVHPCLILR